MFIYKDCEEEIQGLQYVCDPCNNTEGGNIRSLCLIKKGTVLPIPLTLEAIEILIEQEKLFVMPETRGTFDGGTPKMSTGYGDNKERLIGHDYVLQAKDLNFADNYEFWQAVESVDAWNIAYRTENYLAVVYSDVTITTKAPAEEGLDTEIVWNIEAKWYSKEKPTLIVYPANLFLNLFKDYTYVTSLRIKASDGDIKLTVLNPYTCSVILPNGGRLDSVNSIINSVWNGSEGSIVLKISNKTNFIDISNSDFIGEFKSDLVGRFTATSSTLLTGVDCPYANEIICDGCISITANGQKKILDNAYSLYLIGTYETGVINTENAIAMNLSDISPIHNISYNAIKQSLVTHGWSVTIESV